MREEAEKSKWKDREERGGRKEGEKERDMIEYFPYLHRRGWGLQASVPAGG